MTSHEPVSTVIPYFNSEYFIKETLDSVLKCMSPDDEIIIVDDGSCAQSASALDLIVSELESDNVTVVRHQNNLGGSSARNTGIQAAKSSWIFMLDSDNVIPGNLFAEFRKERNLNSAHVYYPSQIRFFKEKVDLIEHTWNFRDSNLTFLDHLRGPYVPSSSGNYFFEKKAHTEIGGYPINAKALDSWGFGLKLASNKKIFRAIPDTFYWHRFGHESYFTTESSTQKKEQLNLIATSLILEKPELIPAHSLRKLARRGLAFKWYSNVLENPLEINLDTFGWFSRD